MILNQQPFTGDIIMSNELVQCVSNVRGYEKDGVAYLHIEDVARGLGFTETHGDAVCIRWQRVEGYLSDIGHSPLVENSQNPHDYYIPENIFYRLCMKAKNAVAEAFQAKVADEIIPSIRRHGMYATDDFIQRSISDPDWAISMLQRLKFEREQKELALKQRDEAVRTKYHFVEGRDAKMCGKVGYLTKENNALKDAVGRGRNWQTISMLTHEWIKRFGHKPDWRKLKEFSQEVGIEPIKDVEETVRHGNGVLKQVKVTRYHKDAWNRYERYETLLAGAEA